MKHLKIKAERFIQWYFEDGEGTEENNDIRNSIFDKVIEKLKNRNIATITTEEIFNDCNQNAIRLSYCEGYYDVDEDLSKFYDIELGDLTDEYTLTLID